MLNLKMGRPLGGEGGVLVLIRNTLKFKISKVAHDQFYNTIWLKLNDMIYGKPLFLAFVYCKNALNFNREWTDQFYFNFLRKEYLL